MYKLSDHSVDPALGFLLKDQPCVKYDTCDYLCIKYMCQRLVVICTGLHSLTNARKDVRFLESVEPSAAREQSQRKENDHVRCLLPYNPLPV